MQSLKHFYSLSLFGLLMLLSMSSYAQHGATHGYLVPVGGGKLDKEFVLNFVSLSATKNPNILIIPHAAKNVARSAKETLSLFQGAGVKNVHVLDLSNPQQALKAIEDSDVIWMPGGGQVRLRKALEQAGVANAILLKYQQGAVIGGTSAGASIQSEVMMASSKRDEKTGVLTPTLSYGLKLWPEVIIDQHFSERNRLERLEIAVKRKPELVGIGVDESTGVVYAGDNKFTVVGKGTVTVLHAVNPQAAQDKIELKKVILKHGDQYDIKTQ